MYIVCECDLIRVVQAPHMRLEVWPTMISPVIREHSWIRKFDDMIV